MAQPPWTGYNEESDYVTTATSTPEGTPKRKARSTNGTSKLAAEELERIRKRLAAAAYTGMGSDYAKLYEKADRDHSGEIDSDEFLSFVRKTLRIPPRELQDAQIYLAFLHIDKDKNGTIDLDEIIEFTREGKGWTGYEDRFQTATEEPAATAPPPRAMPSPISLRASNRRSAPSPSSHAPQSPARSQLSRSQELNPPPKQQTAPEMSVAGSDEWQVNDRVTVKLKNGIVVSGHLQFVGKTAFKEGTWAGIELDKEFSAHAKNDGSIEGIRYFNGTRGMFVGLEYLRREGFVYENSSSRQGSPSRGRAEVNNADNLLRGASLGGGEPRSPAALGSPTRLEESLQSANGLPLSPFRTGGVNLSSISPSRAKDRDATDPIVDIDANIDANFDDGANGRGATASVNVISDSASNLISMVDM